MHSTNKGAPCIREQPKVVSVCRRNAEEAHIYVVQKYN